ncbi:MAG: recombination mediator RecR [Gammaproteobacteria bacterium]|nr:recombination mediator RecR [Gammaproteobacteria bacterium]MDD9799164.1 recombination mediator RecR [Gammaproteobacteria bacterium]MDD9814378.1 recombination mediator RecR [Gammaproteobacteria bacterium]MDD9870743.1 recombination mediator RecR [Gammaproteobacteria bacterium]
MSRARAIEVLQRALRRLPGVGPKGARRMAFHLLERDREGAREITAALTRALDGVVHCKRCNNFSEAELCEICASAKRNARQLCVVETPADLQTVEQAGVYDGLYFVLMGKLSPLDGVGPEDLHLHRLGEVCRDNAVEEMILATNQTTEGEATADYISDLARALNLKITRLARGLPAGAELEYVDPGTLQRAFLDRREL